MLWRIPSQDQVTFRHSCAFQQGERLAAFLISLSVLQMDDGQSGRDVRSN
jgi:hypothetical protein